MKTDTTLIVISIPFTRNLRYLSSSKILDRLREDYDVLLVGPQFKDEALRAEFAGPRTSFWAFGLRREQLSVFARCAYELSEVLRRCGYYFRFRNKGLGFYWNYALWLRLDAVGKNVAPVKWRALIRILAPLGYFRCAWMLIDRIFGGLIFNNRGLLEHTNNYDHVVVVQTANWGYQERFLAYSARQKAFKSILVPYTTDQIIINGYLMGSYDMVCPQGPIEELYLKQHHNLPANRIYPLGMLWRRNIEDFQEKHAVELAAKELQKEQVILYAGMSQESFPRESEFQAINRIIEAMHDGVLPKIKLVYRPVVSDLADFDVIVQRFGGKNLVEIQVPQAVFIGVNESSGSSVRAQINEYLEDIAGVDLLVMSRTTTMLFDALHFDIPCIANFADPSGMLDEMKFTTTYIEEDETLRPLKAMPVIYSNDDLIDQIKETLKMPSVTSQMKKQIFLAWDYENKDYVNGFIELIEGLRPIK